MSYINTRPRRAPRTKPRPDDRVYSPGHLKWIRGRECCVATADFGPQAIVCDQGRCDPHHAKTRGAGGNDSQVVPLCRRHHTQLDSWGIGQETFQDIYKVNLLELAAEYWRLSPHRRKWEQAHGRE